MKTILQKPISTVIFDMDNTLLDFYTAKIAALKLVTEKCGFGDPDSLLMYFLTKEFGYENPENIRQYMIDHNCHDEELYIACAETYEKVKMDEVRIYPEVLPALSHLKNEGYSLAIVTDADIGHAESRLKKTGLYGYFDVLSSPDLSGSRKPTHQSFHYALSAIGAGPMECMMVGDSLVRDIAPAKELNMVACYAEYGDWNRKGAGEVIPDIAIKKFSEILTYLK